MCEFTLSIAWGTLVPDCRVFISTAVDLLVNHALAGIVCGSAADLNTNTAHLSVEQLLQLMRGI